MFCVCLLVCLLCVRMCFVFVVVVVLFLFIWLFLILLPNVTYAEAEVVNSNRHTLKPILPPVFHTGLTLASCFRATCSTI